MYCLTRVASWSLLTSVKHRIRYFLTEESLIKRITYFLKLLQLQKFFHERTKLKIEKRVNRLFSKFFKCYTFPLPTVFAFLVYLFRKMRILIFREKNEIIFSLRRGHKVNSHRIYSPY